MPSLKHCIQGGHPLPPLKQRRHVEFQTQEKGQKTGFQIMSKSRTVSVYFVKIRDCLFLLVIISTCHCHCLILSFCILSCREQARGFPRNKTVPSALPLGRGPATQTHLFSVAGWERLDPQENVIFRCILLPKLEKIQIIMSFNCLPMEIPN